MQTQTFFSNLKKIAGRAAIIITFIITLAVSVTLLGGCSQSSSNSDSLNVVLLPENIDR